jgi:hypothetical protein
MFVAIILSRIGAYQRQPDATRELSHFLIPNSRILALLIEIGFVARQNAVS